MYISKQVHEILREWKSEAKITHLCLYGQADFNTPDREHTLVIYTDQPGPFIGRAGERHAYYVERIRKASHERIQQVHYMETDGIF